MDMKPALLKSVQPPPSRLIKIPWSPQPLPQTPKVHLKAVDKIFSPPPQSTLQQQQPSQQKRHSILSWTRKRAQRFMSTFGQSLDQSIQTVQSFLSPPPPEINVSRKTANNNNMMNNQSSSASSYYRNLNYHLQLEQQQRPQQRYVPKDYESGMGNYQSNSYYPKHYNLDNETKMDSNRYYCHIERKYPLNYSSSTSSTASLASSSSGYSGSSSSTASSYHRKSYLMNDLNNDRNGVNNNSDNVRERNLQLARSYTSSKPTTTSSSFTSTDHHNTHIGRSYLSGTFTSSANPVTNSYAPRSTNNRYHFRYPFSVQTTTDSSQCSTAKIRSSLKQSTYSSPSSSSSSRLAATLLTDPSKNNDDYRHRYQLRYKSTTSGLYGNGLTMYTPSMYRGGAKESSSSIISSSMAKKKFPTTTTTTVTPYRSYLTQKKSISRNYTRVFDSGFDHNDSVRIVR
ncbi:hypothetical protein DERP_014026 [Dermatophagoides pteronyssinus]|uniref:Uncharacterized protein n=1 Tax=Dermatophagoides pteronyssinus TaxID=6956 RepID=A0ABQ8JDB0_DERPT|nr:hypothetical protein DERP_014026 [Dermatophagoides pteronyssinus]